MRSLAALLVLLFLSLTSCKFIREKGWFGKKKADNIEVLLARQDSIRVADSLKAEIAYMKQIEQARIDSIMKVEADRLEQENRFRYHIIVGSFLTPEYAQDHMKLYRSMGYDARIIPDSRDRFNLVSAEVHESLSKAFQRLARFQDTVEFEAWIFINN